MRHLEFFEPVMSGTTISYFGKRIAPGTFGELALRWAQEEATVMLEELTSAATDAPTEFLRRLAQRPSIARMHFLSFQCSLFLVGLAILPTMPRSVLEGVQSGFFKPFKPESGSEIYVTLRAISDRYGKSLYQELTVPREDNGLVFGGGPTANLVYDSILGDYATADGFESSSDMQDSPIDRARVTHCVNSALIKRFKEFSEWGLNTTHENST